jgi:signal peptidase I
MGLKESIRRELFFWEGHGLGQEVKDWLSAFIVAAVAYFIILPALLGTSSPAVVVSSCSERGYLSIGDIIVVQGVSIKDVVAPEVQVVTFDSFTPVFDADNKTTAIIVGNTTVPVNASNDIVVYNAYPSGAQIIHKALARIKTPSGYLLLTKGDANPIPDQFGSKGPCIGQNAGYCISTPITQKMLVGRKILVPIWFFGHVKLFFCDLTFNKLCEGHANLGTAYNYTLGC